ncbi:hypothetical protein EVAR_87583_1 [Eumeta japonica]|uniref:Uncharacterized protein n=1 Tax=Eumeta variegata TaxID=151549 RepID=A0A4C1WL90_EUMVA|nr:hypothetical protein EVAR_87583_1 [Eumeta japonica]
MNASGIQMRPTNVTDNNFNAAFRHKAVVAERRGRRFTRAAGSLFYRVCAANKTHPYLLAVRNYFAGGLYGRAHYQNAPLYSKARRVMEKTNGIHGPSPLVTKATAAAREIYEIEGEDTVNERTARHRFVRFNSVDWALIDHSRCGRTPAWVIEATKESVENQPITCSRRLSDFGASKDIIYRHLKSLYGRTITVEIYREQLRRMYEVLFQTHPD